MTEEELDAERRASWRRLVDCVIAYRNGMTDMVVSELRKVEQTKGRPTALLLKEQVLRCEKHPAWENVHLWPANGYKPPKPTEIKSPRRR